MKIKVKVIAGAKKEEISQEAEFLKVKLKAKPIKGKANEALIEALSEYFHVNKSQINIRKGKTSNIKEVEIEGKTGAFRQIGLQ